MPFADYSGFDSATLQSMTAAYDAAIVRLGIKHPDPRTSQLAVKIVALARGGESDPAAICEKVCQEMRT